MDSFVPEHITVNVLLTVLAISAVCSSIVGSVAAGFEGPRAAWLSRAARNALYLWMFSFPVALVAFISGYLSTAGRSSAVGQILPAVLALIAGLNLYVFGTENRHRVVISFCICLFAGTLFYGTQYGAYQRDATREYRLRQLLAVEARLKTMRRNLMLGDDFPPWLLGTEPK